MNRLVNFLKQLRNRGSACLRFVGEVGSGKTALCYRFLDDRRPSRSRREHAFGLKHKEIRGGEGFTAIMSCYDVPFGDAATRERKLRTFMRRQRSKGLFVVVFSVNNRASFKQLHFWRSKIKTLSPNSACVLVGTQNDLVRNVSIKEAKKKCKELDFMAYFDVSAAKTLKIRMQAIFARLIYFSITAGDQSEAIIHSRARATSSRSGSVSEHHSGSGNDTDSMISWGSVSSYGSDFNEDTLMDDFDIDDTTKVDDIDLCEFIEEGRYGKVHRGIFRAKNIFGDPVVRAVAVKKFRFKDQKERVAIQNEYDIIKDVSHENVVRVYGINFDDATKEGYIILEFCENDLYDYIRNEKLSKIRQLEILYQIAKGMKHIHMRKYCHRDLKPENILIDRFGNVKIADFGTSKMFDDVSGKTMCGTPVYMSPMYFYNLIYKSGSVPSYHRKATGSPEKPEITCTKKEIEEKKDVYSFSIIMWEIMTGKPAFQEYFRRMENNPVGKMTEVHKWGLRPKLEYIHDKTVRKIISRGWDQDINRRPSFDYLVRKLDSMIVECVKFGGGDTNSRLEKKTMFWDSSSVGI